MAGWERLRSVATMEQLQIKATPRQRVAKGDNRRLRREGQVPAVIYGGQQEPQSVAVNDHEIELILRGARHSNAVFQLAMSDGQTAQTIIRDLQRHPVTTHIIHIDFQRVDLANEIEVAVAVHATGAIPVGVKNGGILEHVLREVTVRCKPLDVPKFLQADLSALEMNHSFHVSDLKLPEGIAVQEESDTALFTILPPKGEEVAAAEPAAAEPAVVTKKKAEATEKA
jgi:large subunit ribosomal protein L25